MISILLTFVLLGSFADSAAGQQPTTDALPSVFLIGEFEDEYEQLSVNCDRKLLNNCNEQMEVAYYKWMGLLNDIEGYSDQLNFDLKGIKIWINVFWNADGTIKHLVYYPKPNSKNMDFDQLTDFFDSFLAQYQSPITDQVCFSHNGSANFPIYAKLFVPKEKN